MRLSIVFVCLALVACGTPTRKLNQIQLGMTKQQVQHAMGEPHVARGAIHNRYGQTVEVWEYMLNKPRSGSQIARGATFTVLTFGLGAGALLEPGKAEAYWLYFVDSRLARWGQAGDWKQEADRIYEVRFNSAPGVTR